MINHALRLLNGDNIAAVAAAEPAVDGTVADFFRKLRPPNNCPAPEAHAGHINGRVPGRLAPQTAAAFCRMLFRQQRRLNHRHFPAAVAAANPPPRLVLPGRRHIRFLIQTRNHQMLKPPPRQVHPISHPANHPPTCYTGDCNTNNIPGVLLSFHATLSCQGKRTIPLSASQSRTVGIWRIVQRPRASNAIGCIPIVTIIFIIRIIHFIHFAYFCLI